MILEEPSIKFNFLEKNKEDLGWRSLEYSIGRYWEMTVEIWDWGLGSMDRSDSTKIWTYGQGMKGYECYSTFWPWCMEKYHEGWEGFSGNITNKIGKYNIISF